MTNLLRAALILTGAILGYHTPELLTRGGTWLVIKAAEGCGE